MNAVAVKTDKFRGGVRSSNIELFRILSMLMIVAHHYVVNSGLMSCIDAQNVLHFQDYFLLLFGWGGKTGINCFVLITGYFMCTSAITKKKFFNFLNNKTKHEENYSHDVFAPFFGINDYFCSGA